jgi:RNA polymerase sigma-70 factor (ECF subfamily)
MDSSPDHAATGIDSDLLALIAKGDRRAFGRLYDQSSTLLYTLCIRILGDHDEAADLLQEIYAEVWRKAARYDARRGTPMAWLVTLSRSRAIDRLRARVSRGRALTHSIDDTKATDVQDCAPTPLEQHVGSELRMSVVQALAELPAAQRQALELAYYEGLSHSEIAARLGEPLGTIKTRIKLGMNKLKTTLRSCWE